MKKIVYLVALASVIVVSSCKKGDISSAASTTKGSVLSAKPAAPVDGKYPVMSFATTSHDFGTITTGDKVEYDFAFTNTGEADLLISDAKGSCGCTVPEFPKEAIKPGKTGVMKVIFNSAGKHGIQKKTVTVHTNTQSGTEKLTINVSIKDDETTPKNK